jgi:adenine specific DNA methylase Mod
MDSNNTLVVKLTLTAIISISIRNDDILNIYLKSLMHELFKYVYTFLLF